MRKSLFFILIFICVPLVGLAQPAQTSAGNPAPATGDETIYKLQIRVIFANTTGIFGNLPQELRDMQTVLTQSFRYPAFELRNTIRLSFFGDEDATALVFPEHYIRLTPKGTAKNKNAVKIKAELFHLPPGMNTTTRYFLPQPGNQDNPVNSTFPPSITQEEKSSGERPLLPIISSALLLSAQSWEAVGGVPVRVNMQERVSSNTLSTNRFNSPGASTATGEKRYLILGIKLEP